MKDIRVIDVFVMPKAMKITGRTSSITNAFVNAIVPSVSPTEAEVAEALRILGLAAEDLRCAYCGDKSTEWDHLRPLVQGKRPTGFISEIANLVPACGKCNQSKGSQDWRTWIVSTAKRSPAARGVPDLDERIARLGAYEHWREPTRIDFESIVPNGLWEQYWKSHEGLVRGMKDCQAVADQVRREIADKVKVQQFAGEDQATQVPFRTKPLFRA